MAARLRRNHQEKPVVTTLLRTLPLCAFVLSLICSLFIIIGNLRDWFALMRACLAHWLRARRRRRACLARSRFAPSAFHRFACLAMVMVMSVQGALASPQVSRATVEAVSAKAASYRQDAHLWWHSSGWAARSERFMRENFPNFGANVQQRNWDGKGAPRRTVPKPESQEIQEERNGRVARVDISPREATIAAGEEIHFIAVAYDANNSPVGGVSFDWDKEDADTGEKMNAGEKGKYSSANGRFSSAKEGNYRVKAKFGGLETSAKVKVKGLKYLSGQQPIGTRTVSSRDLPQPPRSSLSLPATKNRVAKNAPGRFATRYSSAGTKAMPRLLTLLDDPYGWTDGNFSTADDPGKERGNPAGHAPDGGAGSGNFQFAAPVLSLGGRGLNLNFGLSYNSRVWHKANSEITFDIDGDWPAPGWSLGFGKIVSMGSQNGYMIIEPDGTRRPYTCSITFYRTSQEAVCKTTDGSFIDYKVIGDAPADGGAPRTSTVFLPNGTEIVYVAATGGIRANYPSQIIDANGNRMLISYRNNLGPQIDKITDPLGRVIQFYYDSNNLPVAITGPGLNGATRTLVRITYESKDLGNLGANYGFSGLTPRVRNNVIPIIKAIYYPANKTGYWFGAADSYSAYGMLAKVIEQRGMDFSAGPLPGDPNQPADPGTITPGLMTRQMVYDYPLTASGLSQEPTYQNTTETWAAMSVDPVMTHYFVQENTSPRRVEITRPDGVKTVMLSYNAPGQWNDGLIYQDETYNPQGALLGKSFVQWEQGDYSSPRPSRVETTDERGQTTGNELSYGPRFNQVIETREYGYGYISGGANTLLRRTVNQYLNDPNYIDPQPALNLVWHHIFNLVTLTDVYDGSGVRLSRTEYSYDQFQGTAGLMDTPGVIGYDYSMSPYFNPNYNIYNLDTRGNITTIKRYADAATLDEGTAVVEIRHYDITGNVRKAETACCMQRTIDYTLNTQYAWPESQVSGSPSDTNKQNTTSAAYDFNTGLVNNSTDANGRPSQTTYDPNTLRPVREYSPTLAYSYHIYDDVAMTVEDFAYEAGLDGPNFASRVDKSLDGLGRVITEIAYGKDNAQDVVNIKYDQLGRVSQQTRPYRAGETPLWSTVTYDFLDRPVQTTAPDNSVVTRSYNQPDPPGSLGQPGETIKVSDPWGRERWARSDALGRMVEVAEPDPGGNGTLSSGAMFTTYTYDALDRLVQVNQGAQTRSFRYDSLGRLTHQKLAERDATLNDNGDWVGAGQWSDVFFYDTRSNLTQSVDARGVKILFIYNDDPLNRLQAVQYDKSGSPSQLSVNIPIAPNVSTDYMTTGDKRRVHNVYVDGGMGNEVMSYDGEGRLSQVYQSFTGRESYPIVTDFIWDSLDRLKENTYPKQYIAGEIRKKVEPAYDVASRIDSLKFGGVTMASNPVYNAASQATSLAVGSQITENYNFDPKTGLLLSQQVNRGADQLLNLQYNYTLNNEANNNGPKTGQLTGITDLKNQARNRAYEYDKLGRLIKVKGGINAFTTPNWYQSYSYDRYGNRSLVQLTALGMAPVKPGSQSRSDLIGKIGPGTDGAANRIFSADEPFASLGINYGYDPIIAHFSDSDNVGTQVRGGPRVTEEESGNAPSANGVGGKSLAKHPAGAAPAAPQKEYGRSGRSIVTVTPLSSNVVSPTAYENSGVSSPSNTGHGDTSFSLSGTVYNSTSKSCRWLSFPNVSGAIQSITLKFDYVATGYGEASTYDESSSADGIALFWVDYSINNGASWQNVINLSADGGAFGTDGYGNRGFSSPNFPSTTTVSVSLPANTPISQIQVRDYLSLETVVNGSGYAYASIGVGGPTRVENIRLEVETDTTPPVISNVAAGGIAALSATITWNTNENSDSQVEYGRDQNYGQSTALNPSLVTAHSQVLSGLTAGTGYHYRAKSGDAAGNLAVSGDFTFTTAPLVISNVASGGITPSSATITWTTNDNSDSQVEYGVDTNYGQSAPTTPNPTLVTAHSQVLSGLTTGTYHYRVKSRNAAGILAISGDFTFTTGLMVISNVAAGGVTTSGATITWTTNDNADSQVEYGVDTGYGLSAPTTPNPALVTAHSQVLSGLAAGTVYHYRVKSRNAAGTLAVSGDFTFTTTQNGSIPLDGLASLSYNSANNRINTPGFEYDPAGNLTRAVVDASGTQQQYRYDCAGRLAQVLDGSGNVLATYSYGAGNQRLMSVEGGLTKYYAWAGGKIIAEYEAWGMNALIWKTSYVYLGERLLATTSGADGNETRFHYSDGLGTRLVTDAGGTVVSEQLSLPFGTMLPFTQTYGGENSYQHSTLSNPSKKRFTTYDRSEATGLDYAVNRFYSSQQGRFTQVDPIELDAASLSDPQTLNMYAYCGNDPINNVDPDGLFWGAIGSFFKAIGKAILSIFTSGSGASSRPDFRTPPTFPGNLPGINAAIRSGIGVFRTPPFIGGFLATGFAELDDIGLVLSLSTLEFAAGALGLFLQAGGGRRRGGRRGGRRAQQQPPPPCGAQLTGDADVDLAARYIYAEGSNDEAEMRGIGQTFVNRYNANRREFGGQNASRVFSRLSIADDNGGSRSFNQAANNDTLRGLSPGDCDRYRTASAASRYVLRTNPNRNQPGGGVLPSDNYYYFLGRGAQTQGRRIGATTFYDFYPQGRRRRR
jgi:RHS repeat-associated protein